MLDALNTPVGNLDFQKLLFLYTKECEREPSYEFVPYKFGGFSFTSYADKRRMMEAGLLLQDDQQWGLTDTGRVAARKHSVQPLLVAGFCRRHHLLRGTPLIAEQYRRFPYYATRSEIVNSVLTDAECRKRVADARPKASKSGLMTIGYEGRSLEAYLNLPRQTEPMALIRGWVEAGERVALTCYEALPCRCHRHCVAEALQQMNDASFEVNHL